MFSRQCRMHPVLAARARASFSSGAVHRAHQPNAPLDLDPSMRALLQDVDVSLLSHRSRGNTDNMSHPILRELEPLPSVDAELEDPLAEEEDGRMSRKSPAARFGSQRIGAIVIPDEMQQSITSLVEESDKHQLHNDAVRLFKNEQNNAVGGVWDSTYDVKYKSRHQAFDHAKRDGTAFATIALPTHYSAIYSVLNNVRNRLGPDWGIKSVYDWGCGTGSAFWASSYIFQPDSVVQDDTEVTGCLVCNTSIEKYVGIERRQGLSAIGKRLLQDINLGKVEVSWRKSFSDEDVLPRSFGKNTLAISSFHLSGLPTDLNRKELVKEMWNSGAETIVLIDHSTKSGFDGIVRAREYLLKLGMTPDAEGEIVGSHVIAPCPHDGPCPLFHDNSSARLVCGFSQRIQRPPFVRKTKHSGTGHEDIGYSYVVVRRGTRPDRVSSAAGRVGSVGQREQIERDEKKPMVELQLHEESHHSKTVGVGQNDIEEINIKPHRLDDEMRETLTKEAFQWPRVVFPPLKRSGHIILDVCAAEGKIMRMTIPKSQGKQPYYDARKSEWGDLFPHEPKNQPQVRYQPSNVQRLGAYTGPREKGMSAEPEASYGRIGREIKTHMKALRKERKRRS